MTIEYEYNLYVERYGEEDARILFIQYCEFMSETLPFPKNIDYCEKMRELKKEIDHERNRRPERIR